MKLIYKKSAKIFGILFLMGGISAGLFIGGAYLYLSPRLPSIDTLKNVQLQVPLRVYAKSGELIAEFGEMKRTPLKYGEFPQYLINAVLAAEDDRFFEHPGVDYQGILRAVIHLLRTGKKGQGGSTITMQVARNFFLSREKTYLRKLNEIFLAFKIEGFLTKEEILALYLNKIYLGKRAYGFSAASQVYYGKGIHQLTVPEFAMVAGLPKAPSSYNPINNPQRALIRRNYVLGRMRSLNFIEEDVYQAALVAPDLSQVHGQDIELEAPYIAEMVRTEMVKRYGSDAYTGGYRVYTTINTDRQRAANKALRNALLGYDRRHGYRGHIGFYDLNSDEKIEEQTESEKKILADKKSEGEKNQTDASETTAVTKSAIQELDKFALWRKELNKISTYGSLVPSLVFQVNDQEAYAYTAENKVVYLPWEHIEWARTYVDDNHLEAKLTSAHQRLKEGDIIYTIPSAKPGCSWLAQKPTVGGALVSLAPEDGAVEALNGGFDYYSSKFNRAIQAQRQPGSSFKPFIYTAALDKGYTAASIIADAPVVFDAPGLEDTWRPENYSGKFYGDTRLRLALIKSRNLVSIRLLRDIGIGYAIRYIKRFGFTRKMLPRDLSLALGSGSLTPYDLAKGYAVFANGGYRVNPYFIDYIVGPRGKIVYMSEPEQVCHVCRKGEAQSDRSESTEETKQKDEKAQSKGSKENITPSLAALPEDLSESFLSVMDEAERLQVNQGPAQLKLAEQILSPQTAFLINTMMRDVIRLGTGRRARVIGRKDLAGKTGTTNDQRDAWFTGFNADLATIAWVGFDNPRPLGDRETGARAALPMWVDYMRDSLLGVKEKELEQPPGLVSVRIDPKTGKLANATTEDAIFEFFLTDQVPTEQTDSVENDPMATSTENRPADIIEDIF